MRKPVVSKSLTRPATGHWFTILPDALLFDLIPRAREFGHP